MNTLILIASLGIFFTILGVGNGIYFIISSIIKRNTKTYADIKKAHETVNPQDHNL